MSQTALKSDTLHENLVRELSRMAPGEKFMTVRDIMRRYNVSQLIVDRAVNRLCEDGKLVIELHIKVTYGLNIAAIVRSITHKVKYAVEDATTLKVERIDVYVDDIV